LRQYISKYNKPVLIGESGLSALPADSSASTLTTADNAVVGLKHAIWAALVSGAMDGRALYWEDSFAIFFPSLSWPFIEKNADVELAASRFAQGIDFAGFKPVPASLSPKVVGAALGHATAVIGWVRDAGCEPPDWKTQAVISKQTVALTVPGSAAKWKVDFYRTQTGTDVISSTTVTRRDNLISLALPDFTDDIAFKMAALEAGTLTTSTTAPTPVTADRIAGRWTGTITSPNGDNTSKIVLVIQPGCKVGGVCGTVSATGLCSGSLFLQYASGGWFTFQEQNMAGASSCVSGGIEQLHLQPQGTLSFWYTYTAADGQTLTSSGVLQGP
jgi:hypothetical protein